MEYVLLGSVRLTFTYTYVRTLISHPLPLQSFDILYKLFPSWDVNNASAVPEAYIVLPKL